MEASEAGSKQLSQPTADQLLQQSITLLFHIIENADDYSASDFYKNLKTYKCAKVNPLNILQDGMNLLHKCLSSQRISLLSALVLIGWWDILASTKVADSSKSSLRGKTVIEISKTNRRLLAEVNTMTEWENSLTPLMREIRRGQGLKLSKEELSDENMHKLDANGGNVLYWVVVDGDGDLFKTFVSLGVNPQKVTTRNENLINLACMMGNLKIIPLLLEKKLAIDPWLMDTAQKTALDRVAENGDIELLQQFVKCGIRPDGSNAGLAAYLGKVGYVKYVVGCPLHVHVDSVDIYNRTLLHRACEGKRIHILNYLRERGANIERVTCTNSNLLHIAAASGSQELMQLVLQLYRDKGVLDNMINKRDKYNGVDLCFLFQGRDKGRDAWHYVEVKRDKVPIFLLKTKQGNVDVGMYGTIIDSGWGISPTQGVIEEIEDKFKQRRLNPNAASDMTPLHIALFKGHKDLAHMLLQGSKVNRTDCFGNTPLMLAAAQGWLDVIKVLEKKGCIFDAVNKDGINAAQIAKENQHGKIRQYIQSKAMKKTVINHGVNTTTDGWEDIQSVALEQGCFDSGYSSGNVSCRENEQRTGGTGFTGNIGHTGSNGAEDGSNNKSVEWKEREKLNHLTVEFLGQAQEKLQKIEKHNTMSQHDIDEKLKTAKTLRLDVDRYIEEVSPEKPVNTVFAHCITKPRDRVHELDPHYGN